MLIDWPYPRIIAHRGAGKLAPENTLAAMKLGHQLGQQMVEFDVKLSADDLPVLMHDASLDRTTNGSGPLRQLDETLHYLQSQGMLANVEIKPSPGLEAFSGGLIARACKSLWVNQNIDLLLSSFSESALHAAKIAAPQLPRALLMDRLFPDWLARCRRLDCVAVDWNERVVNPALVRDAHDCGLRVLVYTVNDLNRAQQLIAWGVDSVITDAVDRLKP
ncbi:MAG: glycerophosphodiester phosphodiesterase [Betaproteobacteria bacterium]|nr:glycerophosphodiester phosphodiesterase [Betaproteobacteria bacterium]